MGKSYDAEEANQFIENLYDQFESYAQKAAPLEADYNRYVHNETFVGKAAEASKRYIRDKQLDFHHEQLNIQNRLYHMYNEIKGEFEGTVDSSPKARIDTDVLKGIKRNIEDFYYGLDYLGKGIEEDAAYLQEMADKYSEITDCTFTRPDYDPPRRALDKICGDGEYIDKCIKDFERFDENAWNYVNRSGLEEYVYDLTEDMKLRAAALDQMEVYEPHMEETLIKVAELRGMKAVKEVNIQDICRGYDGKEKLKRMEQGAKILSAMGDYIEPKIKDIGKEIINNQPDNTYYYKLSSMGLFTFFELAGGVQSYLETGTFADTEKNAKTNYKAFQRGGFSVVVETVTGFLKLPDLGFKIGKGINGIADKGVKYVEKNGTDNLPKDLAAWAGEKREHVITLYNILNDKAPQKIDSMSVEDGYESAGYLLTTIGSFFVGGEAGAGPKAGEAAKTGEVAAEAGETIINSLDDIERAVDKIDDVERVVDKLDDIEKVADKADDIAKTAEEAEVTLKKIEDTAEVAAEASDDVAKVASEAEKLADKGDDVAKAVEKGGSAAEDGLNSQVSYDRPSGFRKGVRDKVWDNAKNSNGDVIDPVTKKVMDKSEPWDMGHKPGYEFRKHQQSAESRGIPRKQFLDEYNNPEHYRPELPSSNRSHKGEDITDNYFGD
ncbi:LXG domain of WXG superfamily protein [Butyrivibrio sp. INlla21]|nr:LXG domain of WXG superfamily protein [Butyrivibrio sp. INlla21]